MAERARVGFVMRKGWLIGGAAVLLLSVLLLWAWLDGGERPLSPHSAPAMLPRVGA